MEHEANFQGWLFGHETVYTYNLATCTGGSRWHKPRPEHLMRLHPVLGHERADVGPRSCRHRSNQGHRVLWASPFAGVGFLVGIETVTESAPTRLQLNADPAFGCMRTS